MRIKPEEISKIIRSEIENYKSSLDISNTGTVLEVGDGIARIYGLSDVMAGELLEFENGTVGMALNLEESNIGAVIFGKTQGIKEGSIVKGLGKVAEVPAGNELLGRVVDALGNPIDGKGSITAIFAKELSEEQRELLIEKLEKKYGKKIVLNLEVDKEIIGGGILKIGNEVINGSIKNQIEEMKKNF